MSTVHPSIGNLSAEEKRALLARLLQEKSRKARSFPLSFAQQRLWFLEQLTPGTHAYHVTTAMQLHGALQAPLIQRTLQAIVERHEAFRTIFVVENGQPVQRITAPAPVELPLVDLRELPAAERMPRARHLASVEQLQPFDLQRGPLARFKLLRLDETEYVLLLSMHHIICDNWSMGVFLRELTTFYSALYDNPTVEPSALLPEPPIQYADYAVWQREQLQGAALDAEVAYWQQQLAGAPGLLTLPTDRPRPPVQTTAGATHSFSLSADLTAALKALSRREGATLFMTLLAGWQTLLSRYSGQERIVVGTPVAGRTRTDLEGLIGLFFNTLALHTDLSGDPSFRELLARVRAVCLGAYAHQDLPFEKLVEALRIERNLSHTLLFQAVFDLHNTPTETMQLPGVTISWWPEEVDTAKFDVSLAMDEGGEQLHGTIEYNTDLFDAATIERLAEHFRTLLGSIVATPEAPLSQLSMLSRAEREHLLVERNATYAPYPAERAVHQLIRDQVRRTPDAIAVQAGSVTLTYQELEQRANQLAHTLHAHGVERGDRVALCLERSVDMVVSLLAIFCAGAAFVPLDPGFPPGRMAYILEDSQATLLLTESTLIPSLPELSVPQLLLDDDALLSGQPTTPPADLATGADLAYLIYTSGSTGRPKGVLIPHSGLLNYLYWCADAYTAAAGRGAPVHASIAADAIFPSLFAPLLAGTTVFLLPPREPLVALAADLETNGNYSLVKITPSQLDVLSQYLHSPSAAGWIHTLVVGAEEVRGEGLRFWQSTAPETVILNEYGPTETVVGCSIYRVPPTPISGSVPIGLPIPNLTFYVLDPAMQPAPVGVPGELYIGGDGVAWGYHGRPALTAEKFVPDPFAGAPGARLYRTGDLVRYLADPEANIVFLGRIDDQVKIRGYRVEPGEVEEILRLHPSVREAVVLARQDGVERDKRLVAYVVVEPGAPAERAPLQAFLQERLPEYMLPSAYVFLPAIPLAPHGKIDRAALPAPTREQAEPGSLFVAPRSPVEAQLAQIWAQVLGFEQIGVHDNFFQLGGDSIRSIQIIARANQAGLRLTPTQLFQHQTIAELATVAGAAQAIVAEQGPVTGAAPLTPIQRWFFAQRLAEAQHYNQSMLLEARQPLDRARLERSLQHLLHHHDALRLRFEPDATGWRQIAGGPEAPVAFEVIDLTAEPAAARSAAISAAAARIQASLDLTAGPIMRAALFDLGAHEPSRLLIVIHHLAVDSVSWQILLEDLNLAYMQLSQGRPVSLPPKTTAFKYWAERLSDYARSDTAQAELQYWLQAQPASAPPLPRDRATGANIEATAQTVRVALEPAETRDLLINAPAAYRTQINDVLLTALVQAFAGWTGRDALLIELEGHGREDLFDDVDLSRTVGWFTTLFPVHLDLGGSSEPGAALKTVKEQLRRIPHHGLGYGLLRWLNTVSSEQLHDRAQAEVAFNYLGQFDQVDGASSLFRFADEPSGPPRSPNAERPSLIEINSLVVGGRLQIEWRYSPALHDETTIAAVAEGFVAALRTLIAHCTSPEAGGATPSDFPLAQLDQRQLDALLKHAGPIVDIYPLAPMQQGMLFHNLYTPASDVYVAHMHGVLPPQLDVDAFHAAWQQVVDHYPALRTSFHWSETEAPLQVVHQHAPLPLERLDWQALSQSEQQARLAELLAADRQRGFALDAAPLMRLTLIALDAERSYFIWTLHHLIVDGWSLSMLLNQVLQCYDARCRGQALQLPPSHAYRDYIAWLQQQDLAQAARFWRQSLRGIGAPTPLGIDRPSEARLDAPVQYGDAHLALAEPTTQALKALAQQQQLTMNTLVQGAWALLLSRYSGERDVLFGATVSGRPAQLSGVETMIGVFINTLPVRVRVQHDLPLISWLQQLQAQQAELRQYEYSPLVEVQGWSEIPRGQPLFESIVVFENQPIDTSVSEQQAGLAFYQLNFVEQTNYPLTVLATAGAQLLVRISYDRSRFPSAAIERLVEHLRTLLTAIASAPAQRVGALPLLTAAEQEQQIVAWNATAQPYPHERCIHDLAALQCARTPDAVAVSGSGVSLSYAELDARANQLAQRLQQLGVGPEVRVGLCLRREPDLLVALLAVLKAGGAYVPLDPSYPAERLQFMLSDSQAAVLIVHRDLRERLPAYAGSVIELDSAWPEIERLSSAAPVSRVTSDNLAYVIYTSGSTGTPKGVAIAHRSTVALLTWASSIFSDDQLAGVLAATSICFDLSVFELLLPLSRGGTVLIVENVLQLPELPAEPPVTLINTVPSAIGELLNLGRLPDSVRVVNLAGEALPLKLVQRIYQQPTVQHVFNLYGPSEDTTYSTYARIAPDSVSAPPIGRPIANTQAYILDDQLHLTPTGVAGELYLGGDGLARGYLNRPALTAERFVPNPFLKGRPLGQGSGPRDESNSFRLYKTGDLARYRADGTIEYLGRRDHQIKLRGFRIELQEIETALRQHPAVQQAVVVVRDDEQTSQQLIAYVVAGEPGARNHEPTENSAQPTAHEGTTEQPNKAPGDALSAFSLAPSALRAFLAQRLPEHMLPSLFVPLDALPLTPNGKLDRRGLPAPTREQAVAGNAFVAPRDALEQQIAAIWQDVLGIEQIGVYDSFFDLGGHSISAVRLIARMQQQFQRQLPLSALLEGTVAQLAQLLRQHADDTLWSALVPIQPAGARRPFFCVHPFGGDVLAYYTLARHLGPDQPFYGLQAPPLHEAGDHELRIEDMAADYIQALRTVQPTGPYQLGGWSFGGLVAFEMAQQLQRAGEQVTLLALFDTRTPDKTGAPEYLSDALALATIAREHALQVGKQLPIDFDQIQQLPPDDQLHYVLDEIKRIGLDFETELAWIRRFVAGMRVRERAIQLYQPQLYNGPLTLFQATEEDPQIQKVGALMGRDFEHPTHGWSSYVVEPIQVYQTPGYHGMMIFEPYVQTLAAQLDACLEPAPVEQ